MPEFLSLDQLRTRRDVGGVVEELVKQSPLLAAMPFVVDPRGIYRYGVRVANPTVAFRRVNGTITPSVSTVDDYVEEMAIAESNFWIDDAAIYGDPIEAIAGEAPAHVEEVTNTFADGFYYGDRTSAPEGIDGLNTRLLLSSTPDTAGQVVSAGGSGSDLMSVWIVSLRPDGLFGFCSSPEDLLKNEYKGPQQHASKGTWGQAAHIKMRCGLVLKDVKAAAQICNIETSGTSNILTEDLLWSAISRVRNPTHILANGVGWRQIQKVARGTAVVQKDQWGHPFFSFGPVPVYIDDHIVVTETAKAA